MTFEITIDGEWQGETDNWEEVISYLSNLLPGQTIEIKRLT